MTEEVLMTDEQLQRIHDIEYSCDSRAELAERIVALEEENAVLTIKHNAEHIIRQNVEADNAKLREELEQWERLTAGIELPEYPISQFQPKDLERENAKLRELVADTYQAFQRVIPDGHRLDLEQRMRELRVEVDG